MRVCTSLSLLLVLEMRLAQSLTTLSFLLSRSCSTALGSDIDVAVAFNRGCEAHVPDPGFRPQNPKTHDPRSCFSLNSGPCTLLSPHRAPTRRCYSHATSRAGWATPSATCCSSLRVCLRQALRMCRCEGDGEGARGAWATGHRCFASWCSCVRPSGPTCTLRQTTCKCGARHTSHVG